MITIYAAPLQGFTELAWRNAHAQVFGGIDAYYTPFVRLEKGEIRNKDKRELLPAGNTVSRLIPQIVIRSKDEDEVSQLLKLASRHGLPVTFRAAGTSLSGQAISDSILIVAGKNWEKYSISADYEQITLQPGIIGQRVNELLAPYEFLIYFGEQYIQNGISNS